MNQLRRMTQGFVVGILLVGAVAIAQAGTSKSDKTSAEHHSKASKLAFWRHHNDKNTKQNVKTAKSKQAQSKAQVKPTSAKQTQGNNAQMKPVSAKQPASNRATKNTPQAPSTQHAKTQSKSMTAQNMHAPQKDSSKQ